MDHPNPWLRYVESSRVSDKTLPLDSLKVRNAAGEELGTVDGLIVDATSGRPFHVVVAATEGWFRSRKFLVPTRELHLSTERDALMVALTRDQVSHFPGFDTDEFESLSEEEIRNINDAIGELYSPGAESHGDSTLGGTWARPSYRIPEWWNGEAGIGRDHTANSGSADRAQPGDILGIENDGEQTHVGETREDEVERRRSSEAAVTSGE